MTAEKPSAGGLPEPVHRGALLGLLGATGRRLPRIRSAAPAVARVEGKARRIVGERSRALWNRDRASAQEGPGFGLPGDRFCRNGVQRDEDCLMRGRCGEGWVLYDGDCGFCVRRLRFWSPALRLRGFERDSLQADWTARALGPAEGCRRRRLPISREGDMVGAADSGSCLAAPASRILRAKGLTRLRYQCPAKPASRDAPRP